MPVRKAVQPVATGTPSCSFGFRYVTYIGTITECLYKFLSFIVNEDREIRAYSLSEILPLSPI